MSKRISLEPPAFLALNWGVVLLVSLFYAGRTLILKRYTHSLFASDRSDIPLWTTYILYMAITICLTWYCNAVLRARKLDPALLNPYYDLPEHEVVIHGKMWLFMKVTYIVATWLSRATFLCVYINVRATLKRGARTLLWVTTAWCVLGFAVDVVLTLAWCRPISTNWKTNGTRCTPWTITTTTLHCIFALSSDILIMLLPLFILRHLRLARSQRAATAFVLFLGFFCCLLAILRFALIVFNVLQKDMSKNHTYQDLDLLVAVVECTLLCIASTLPAYRLVWTVGRRRAAGVGKAGLGGGSQEGIGARKGSRGTDDTLLEDGREPWEKDIPDLKLPIEIEDEKPDVEAKEAR